MSIRILDVGQCGIDGPRMKRLFQEELDAEVDEADTLEETREKLRAGTYDLVLVNRVLNEDGSSGVDLIDEVKRGGADVPIMLVSDRSDAQDEAVSKGALRGFGKAELESPKTLDMIRKAAGDA